MAVSPDPLNKFKEMIRIVTARTGGEFVVTLLSDADHRVIDLYGLRNEQAAKSGTFVPYPTTYVIDSSGRVRWRFTEKNQAVRPSNEAVISEVRKLW